jgi:hypothetical protein
VEGKCKLRVRVDHLVGLSVPPLALTQTPHTQAVTQHSNSQTSHHFPVSPIDSFVAQFVLRNIKRFLFYKDTDFVTRLDCCLDGLNSNPWGFRLMVNEIYVIEARTMRLEIATEQAIVLSKDDRLLWCHSCVDNPRSRPCSSRPENALNIYCLCTCGSCSKRSIPMERTRHRRFIDAVHWTVPLGIGYRHLPSPRRISLPERMLGRSAPCFIWLTAGFPTRGETTGKWPLSFVCMQGAVL